MSQVLNRGGATAARRVILVGNNNAFGKALEAELGQLHFEVELATPAMAIELVSANLPDLVVLDLTLRDGAAMRLLHAWKGLNPAPLVVLASDQASLPVVVEAFGAGAHSFLKQPVTASALVGVLAKRDQALGVKDHSLSEASLKADGGVDHFFAVSPGLLSIAGFDGYFKMLNPAWEKTLGFTVEELCAKPYHELIHPDDRQRASHEALEICSGQTVFHYRNRYLCKDGSYRWLSWSVTPASSTRLIYGSTKDVTRIVTMEQTLMRTNEELKAESRAVADRHQTLTDLGHFKDEVTDMLVHDLKGPLAVILSNYQFLVESFDGSAECVEALNDSQSAGRRMLRLLANLTDVGGMENKSLVVKLLPTDLSKLLAPLIEQRRTLCRAKELMLTLVPFETMVAIADLDLLTRTLENILDNALRHTPSGGQIEVSARQVDGWVEVRVGNSGEPIPVAQRELIFQKFGQAAHQGQGRMNLGLGLYFSRLATEAQGGEVRVEQSATMATVFCVRLPSAASATIGPLAA